MQPLYTAGAGIMLAVALASLSAGIAILIKIGNPKRIHAVIYFVISVILLIFFAFLWQSASIQLNQATPPPITPLEVNDMWPLWLSAIGTIALALITFTISMIIPWIKKPKFEIEFENKEPFCRDVDMRLTELLTPTITSYWLRLKVKNIGKTVAKHCIGKLVKVMDPSGRELNNYDPVILHWVGTNWGEIPFRHIDLNQGEHEFLDLFQIKSNTPERLNISTTGDARGIPTHFPPGTYIILVTVYGDNIYPCSKRFSVIWGASHYRDVKLDETSN